MQLVEIREKNILNTFLAEQGHSQFLQTWEWGELNNSLGFEVKYLGVEHKNKLIAALTIIKKNLGMGKCYWYSPRGPIMIADSQKEISDFLFSELEKKAKQEKIIFFRFDPLYKIMSATSSIKKTIDIQPGRTLILDISNSEDDLLSQMHQKTRYNIRLAQKKGIEIFEMDSQMSNFEDWWKILEETKARDGFKLHDKNYYNKMLSNFFSSQGGNLLEGKSNISESQSQNKNLAMKLLLAKYQGKIIAGNLISFFGDTATYVHGASANEYRNVMAPYFLQWQTIKLAKSRGFKYYDFFGIDEIKWPGVTRFKKGFSGNEFNYPGTLDLVFNDLWYNTYKIARKIRRLI